MLPAKNHFRVEGPSINCSLLKLIDDLQRKAGLIDSAPMVDPELDF
jgi:hypothetical protein